MVLSMIHYIITGREFELLVFRISSIAIIPYAQQKNHRRSRKMKIWIEGRPDEIKPVKCGRIETYISD